jgi:hypothetical protein
VILEYVEESWLGRAQNKVIGVIFTYDPASDTKTKIKEVPEADVLGRIEGSWMDKLYYTLGSAPFNKATEKILLIDLNPLNPVPKTIPGIEEQCRNESRRFWDGVTKAIVGRQYGLATTLKQELEEKQREKAKERKDAGREWQVSSPILSIIGMVKKVLTCPCSHGSSRAPSRRLANRISRKMARKRLRGYNRATGSWKRIQSTALSSHVSPSHATWKGEHQDTHTSTACYRFTIRRFCFSRIWIGVFAFTRQSQRAWMLCNEDAVGNAP